MRSSFAVISHCTIQSVIHQLGNPADMSIKLMLCLCDKANCDEIHLMISPLLLEYGISTATHCLFDERTVTEVVC